MLSLPVATATATTAARPSSRAPPQGRSPELALFHGGHAGSWRGGRCCVRCDILRPWLALFTDCDCVLIARFSA